MGMQGGDPLCGAGTSLREARGKRGLCKGCRVPEAPQGRTGGESLFAPCFPGAGCSQVLPRAGSCRCSTIGAGGKQGWPQWARTSGMLPPSSPITSGFTLSTSSIVAGGRGWSGPPHPRVAGTCGGS